MFFRKKNKLIDLLPDVKGRYSSDAPLDDLTWFNVGGPAEVLFRPADEDDLARFLRKKPHNVTITVIGIGSNLLIRDGGVPGVVVRLGSPFTDIKVEGEKIICGAALTDKKLAKMALKNSIGGFEFLEGIPGTIGGAIKMNAGSFGREMKDIIESVTIVDEAGKKSVLELDELNLSYRKSFIPKGWIITSATLRGYKEDYDKIKQNMSDFKEKRESSQPIKAKTAGSTFKNPPGLKAWKLIESCGCKDMKIGGASLSKKHCNFIVNNGDATANDIEMLGEAIIKKVKAKTSIELKWEVRRIGVKRACDSTFGGAQK
jgi:UDP-N-acetylmuramate dehydrogenase